MHEEPKGRGGWWVVAQIPLLAATIVAPVAEHLLARAETWAPVVAWPSRLLGLTALTASCITFSATKRALGSYLVAYPKPLEGATLRRERLYALVRHPMYLAIIGGVAGWALLWTSVLGLLLAVACAAFFALKTVYEERFLRARFPEYSEYARSVPRLIPRLRAGNRRVP